MRYSDNIPNIQKHQIVIYNIYQIEEFQGIFTIFDDEYNAMPKQIIIKEVIFLIGIYCFPFFI